MRTSLTSTTEYKLRRITLQYVVNFDINVCSFGMEVRRNCFVFSCTPNSILLAWLTHNCFRKVTHYCTCSSDACRPSQRSRSLRDRTWAKCAKSIDNFTADCLISVKFGREFDHVISNVLKTLKVTA